MISSEKQMLRSRIGAELSRMSPDARVRASAAVAANLVQRLGENAGTIFGFAPLRQEPDWTAALAAGWKIALPRIEQERLVFHHVDSLDVLVSGAFGTREPVNELGTVAPISSARAVLVPGVAFDRLGRRLGRGGGFYDRFLAVTGPQVLKIGVCFDLQIVEEVPSEPHDVRMDAVVTESGWIEMPDTATRPG